MSESVSSDSLMLGLEGAYDRLSAAIDRNSAFQALFEALNWINTIDHRFGQATRDHADWLERAVEGHLNPGTEATGAIYLRAIRYARNSVHHQWADAVEYRQGAEFPLNLTGQAFNEWVWKPNVPEPKNKQGQDEYLNLLAGKASRHSIHYVATLFAVHHGLVGASRPSWLLHV